MARVAGDSGGVGAVLLCELTARVAPDAELPGRRADRASAGTGDGVRGVAGDRLVLGGGMRWRDATFAVWAALGLVATGLLVAQLQERLPGLRAAFRRLTARPAARGALLLAWMWLGWHVFAR